MNNCFCTVFTPTYNRAYLLNDLYNSLLHQTYKDFEWIIVDDGSSDNTEEIVKYFIDMNQIKIKYMKVKNGGKHRAINYGIELAEGEVFAIVDSDDKLTINAIEKIFVYFSEIKKIDKKFAGISVNRGYSETEMIGATFPNRYIDAKNTEREKYNIKGDKFEIYYTNILKKYKFPTFDGENFLSEIVVWNRLARDGFLIRWYNDILYICNYLDDGLTRNNLSVLRNNPLGYALRIREQVEFGNISLKSKWGYYSNYFCLLKDKKSIQEISNDLNAPYFELILSTVLRKFYMIIKGEVDVYKKFKD